MSKYPHPFKIQISILTPTSGKYVNPMKSLFNKLKWTGQRAYFWYINRGAQGGEEMATTDDLVEVGSNGVVISTGGKAKYIPYHRIVEVRLEDGRVLLNRRRS